MDSSFRNIKQAIVGFIQSVLQEKITQLELVADQTQLNRRARAAWRAGRSARACYLTMEHHRRRLERHAEIRRLVEGPVRGNLEP